MGKRTINYTNMSVEHMAMNEFKLKLQKIAKLTPESFFRICDCNYQKEIASGDFKNKIK